MADTFQLAVDDRSAFDKAAALTLGTDQLSPRVESVAAECGDSPPTYILPCYPGPLYGLVRHSTVAFRASGISGRPKVRCEIEIRFGAFDAEAASRLGEVWPPAGAQRESYPGAVDAPVFRDNRSLVELLLPVPPGSGSVTPSDAGSGSAACICLCG
jgi:hypothetical protein